MTEFVQPNRVGPKTSTALDRHIGARIRIPRGKRGVSRVALAQALGVSFQQVQKYERGESRIGAARLYMTARALGVRVTDFFLGYRLARN